jgi:endo-1,4-beta-xylanase
MKTPLVSTLVALTAPLLYAATPATATPSIADLYADSFRIGVALSAGQIVGSNPAEARVRDEHFNSYTAENEMKWERIHPTEGEYDFEIADTLADLGESNDAFLVGHTLVWHNQTPDWVFEDATGEPASREHVLQRMRDHITTVVTRYRGRFDGWDVVNEAIVEDGSMRETKWREALGDDYIAEAFTAAHAADPEAKLYYNDYNLWKPEKRAGAVRIVKDLQSRGVPIHGVGLQGHYGIDSPPLEELEASIEAFAALGVAVMITELDVSVLPFPDSDQWGADLSVNFALSAELNPYADGLPADVRVAQDNHYRALFAIFLKHRDVIDRVTFWNLHDGSSWKNNWPVRGRTDYPVIFDRNHQPKSTYRALIDLKLAYDEAP